MAPHRVVFVMAAVLLASRLLFGGELENPVRIEADGTVIDTGKAWGHSGPCVEDVDGDGLADLIVGDFSGKFHFYKNVGQEGLPVYQDAGFLQAGGEDAEVRIYCCVGSQARFADLDGDGIRDLVSNSYDPGHCYLFRGMPDHKFAAREELLDKAGVPLRSSPKQNQNYQSFGSFFTPVDWDTDGDFDMLIGCFDGHLKLRLNEGSATEATFAAENETVQVGGEPLKVTAHCSPVVADWDGDGLWDLLSGNDDGSVTWFQNTGTKKAPQFEAGEILVAKCRGEGYDNLLWSEEDIVPGIRSQVEVADLNGDGKLDLLLGDFYSAYDLREGLTEEEKDQLEQLVSKRADISKQFSDNMKALREEFAERYPDDAIYSEEADKAWSEAYKALKEGPVYQAMEANEAEWVKKMRPYLANTRGEGDRAFDLAMSHGHVWLFLRKSAPDVKTSPQPEEFSTIPPHVDDKFVVANLRVQQDHATIGDTTEVSVELDIAPLWEIRAVDTEPQELATQLDLRLPSGIEASGDWQSPKPSRSISPDGHNAYADKAVFTREIKITDSATKGEQSITCDVHYQACNERQCLQPTKVKLAVSLYVE